MGAVSAYLGGHKQAFTEDFCEGSCRPAPLEGRGAGLAETMLQAPPGVI